MSPRPIEFPVEGLGDGVVRLRLLTDADLPALVEAIQDPEIPRFTTIPHPYGDEEALHWKRMAATGVASGTDLPTMVVSPDDDRLLGAVGVHGLDPATGRCSAGYWVAAPERGRGVATRALALLCRHAFEQLGVMRVEAWIDPANVASLKVAERVGFTREGLLRSFMAIGGRRRDMLMYSLLPGEASASNRGRYAP